MVVKDFQPTRCSLDNGGLIFFPQKIDIHETSAYMNAISTSIIDEKEGDADVINNSSNVDNNNSKSNKGLPSLLAPINKDHNNDNNSKLHCLPSYVMDDVIV